ncbi:MAG: M6 family metalloprotease domain-containing protein [Spirochaetia bacterium]|nr:M6 family metalloprotease domain-containing protein [Spirochaetia bacterium]
MKKLVGIVLLCLIAAVLYAVPPKPGTKHGGCIHLPGTQAPFRSPSKQASDSSLQKISPLSPAVGGDRNILVILVEFSDKQFSLLGAGATDEDYRNYYLDLLQNNTYSMRKYYQDMSDGKLNLTFTVIGPYTLDHDKAHYGTNEIKSDNMDLDTLTGDIAWEAVDKAITNNPSVFSVENLSKWDYDGNGEIDTFFVIHAGIGEEEGINLKDIYSLRWFIYSAYINGRATHPYLKYGGKYFNAYTIQPECLYASNEGALGTFCHEYGHSLGLVDLYDTTSETAGAGDWSLMGGGSWGSGKALDPVPLLAWEKYYMGWLTPTTITPTAKPQTFNFSDTETSREAWKINLTDDGSQYLILEGKKRNLTGTGWAGLEDGLLITHIVEDILDACWTSNTVNDSKTWVHGINIVEAQSPYYETTGLGNLWKYPAGRSGIVCFRNNTKSILVPSYPKAAAGIGLFVSLLLLHRKRKKFGTFLLICCLACIIACDDGGETSSSGSGDDNGGIVIPDGDTGFHYVKGQDIPNTNYYTSALVTSKTGISGIIITVDCPAGSSSGSFTVMKEE